MIKGNNRPELIFKLYLNQLKLKCSELKELEGLLLLI